MFVPPAMCFPFCWFFLHLTVYGSVYYTLFVATLLFLLLKGKLPAGRPCIASFRLASQIEAHTRTHVRASFPCHRRPPSLLLFLLAFRLLLRTVHTLFFLLSNSISFPSFLSFSFSNSSSRTSRKSRNKGWFAVRVDGARTFTGLLYLLFLREN